MCQEAMRTRFDSSENQQIGKVASLSAQPLRQRCPVGVPVGAKRLVTRYQPYHCPILYLQILIFESGADGIRTHALRRAKAALSRLSYGPDRAWWGEFTAVGRRRLTGFEFGGCAGSRTRGRRVRGRVGGRLALTEGLCEI